MKTLQLIVLILTITFSAFAQDLPEMIEIKGGVFKMGLDNGSNINDAAPTRSITLASFYLGKTPITVAQWKYFVEKTGKKMPVEPSWGWKDNHPMVNITWAEAVEYCDWLSEQTGKIVRLPTEAEWEYASREDEPNLLEIGWFQDSGLTGTQPVGQKKANKLGLYDMEGNVWQWCRDWYGWYKKNQTQNPIGPYTGSFRIIRGGSWYNYAKNSSVLIRQKSVSNARLDYIGFRVASNI